MDSEDLAPAPRGSKAVSLERATLVYYEWGANEAEPAKPVLGLARQEGGRPQILVRSNDLFTIGRLPAALGTSPSFSQTAQRAVPLLDPEWRPAPDAEFAIPEEQVIDDVFVAARPSAKETGRSWQASAPSAANESEERVPPKAAAPM